MCRLLAAGHASGGCGGGEVNALARGGLDRQVGRGAQGSSTIFLSLYDDELTTCSRTGLGTPPHDKEGTHGLSRR